LIQQRWARHKARLGGRCATSQVDLAAADRSRVRTAATLGAGLAGLATLATLAGCAALGVPPKASAPGATSTVTPGTNANTTYVPGNAVPSPAPTSVPLPSSTATLPALPTLAVTTSTTSYAGASVGPCGYRHSGAVDGLTTEPGAGTLTVTWWHPGDPTVQSYRLAAVSQQFQYGVQPDPNWVTIAPASGCQSMTTTLTGLARGTPYVVWLDAVTKTPLGTRTEELMVGRSSVVSTT
jgi:hypothetical protein